MPEWICPHCETRGEDPRDDCCAAAERDRLLHLLAGFSGRRRLTPADVQEANVLLAGYEL